MDEFGGVIVVSRSVFGCRGRSSRWGYGLGFLCMGTLIPTQVIMGMR